MGTSPVTTPACQRISSHALIRDSDAQLLPHVHQVHSEAMAVVLLLFTGQRSITISRMNLRLGSGQEMHVDGCHDILCISEHSMHLTCNRFQPGGPQLCVVQFAPCQEEQGHLLDSQQCRACLQLILWLASCCLH